MVVPGGAGWKLPAIADAVLEDKIKHADLLGTADVACPVCKVVRPMRCYRFAGGAFGTHKGLHLVCPTCGGRWTADKADSETILASMVPADRAGGGDS